MAYVALSFRSKNDDLNIPQATSGNGIPFQRVTTSPIWFHNNEWKEWNKRYTDPLLANSLEIAEFYLINNTLCSGVIPPKKMDENVSLSNGVVINRFTTNCRSVCSDHNTVAGKRVLGWHMRQWYGSPYFPCMFYFPYFSKAV